MITIVDHGAGNLRSLLGACEYLGIKARVSSSPDEVMTAERLVLPGVGSFRSAMLALGAQRLDTAIQHAVRDRATPVLGICLGMQLLAESGDEDGVTRGLGLLPGRVARFDNRGLRLPHVGFNLVELCAGTQLFAGMPPTADFYFVHSYRLLCQESTFVSAWATYGERFAAAVERGCVFGTQFHPEKSQMNGLRVLMAFARIRAQQC